MYLETLEPTAHALADSPRARRSLSGDFVFVTQDADVEFAAGACMEVLRAANRLLGQDSYRWTHLGGEAGLLRNDPPCGPDRTLVLIGGLDAPWRPAAPHLRALRNTIRSAARVCLVGAGVFVPLAAGVLGARRLAVHPDFHPGVLECAPRLDLSPEAVCHHGAVSSAISPTAAVRMMVDLVGARDGDFTGAGLTRYLGLSDLEGVARPAAQWRYTRLAQGDPVISEALQIMLDHLEDTLSVGQIADLLGVSPRKLERGFREFLRQTPLRVYRDLRLDRARSLMVQTALPMNEISVACGFSNVTLMKKWFSQKYGEPPEEVRRRALGGCRAA